VRTAGRMTPRRVRRVTNRQLRVLSAFEEPTRPTTQLESCHSPEGVMPPPARPRSKLGTAPPPVQHRGTAGGRQHRDRPRVRLVQDDDRADRATHADPRPATRVPPARTGMPRPRPPNGQVPQCWAAQTRTGPATRSSATRRVAPSRPASSPRQDPEASIPRHPERKARHDPRGELCAPTTEVESVKVRCRDVQDSPEPAS
jgi:hypothetical protein